jgi:hypothetical protein
VEQLARPNVPQSMHAHRPSSSLALVVYTLAALASGVVALLAPPQPPTPPEPAAESPVVLLPARPPPTIDEIRRLMAEAKQRAEKRPPVVDPLTPIETGKGQPTANANARAQWNGIRRSEGCWFFSGPAPLGRDHRYGDRARLEKDGATMTLRFGDAVFTGRNDNGRVRLHRELTNKGEGWRVSELITGSLRQGELVARYRYRECALDETGACELGAQPGDHCTIKSFLWVEDPT